MIVEGVHVFDLDLIRGASFPLLRTEMLQSILNDPSSMLQSEASIYSMIALTAIA